MQAIDTNILARFFIDDPDDAQAQLQRPQAIDALSHSGFIAVTVILEFEWVMRGFYRLERATIHAIFSTLLKMTHLHIEDRHLLISALVHYHNGLDFADSLHQSRAQHCTSLLTFDQKFAKKAHQLNTQPPVQLLQTHHR